MAVEVISQLNQMSISESSWTVICGAEDSTHENGNYESAATSTGTSPDASFMNSSTSSFSSISDSGMSLPKSIVKKRRVGSNAHETYGQVTFEDEGSEGAITDEEPETCAKPKEGEVSFTNLGDFDGDDESSEEESDEDSEDEEFDEGEDSDDESVADSYPGNYNTVPNYIKLPLTSLAESDNEPCASASFITFTESVSFNMTVSYANPPDFDDSDFDDSDSEDDPEETMTVHEKMVRFFAARTKAMEAFGTPEEHGRDILDVDKRLLAGYINGIHTANESYEKDLASLALNINQGLSDSPFVVSSLQDGGFLNHALLHISGIFPNLLTDDELEGLLDDALCGDDSSFKRVFGDDKSPTNSTTGKSPLQEVVSHFLSERLIDETMSVEKHLLDFFARGIVYRLKEWASEEDL